MACYSTIESAGTHIKMLLMKRMKFNLLQFVQSLRQDLHIDTIAMLMYTMATTVSAIHSKFIIHGELIPANIRFDSNFSPIIANFSKSLTDYRNDHF